MYSGSRAPVVGGRVGRGGWEGVSGGRHSARRTAKGHVESESVLYADMYTDAMAPVWLCFCYAHRVVRLGGDDEDELGDEDEVEDAVLAEVLVVPPELDEDGLAREDEKGHHDGDDEAYLHAACMHARGRHEHACAGDTRCTTLRCKPLRNADEERAALWTYQMVSSCTVVDRSSRGSV
jgi:hypothetical protein